MKQDPLSSHRRLIAEIDAETRHEQDRLDRMTTDGVDHFRRIHAQALPTLTPDTVGAYSRQAGALAALQDSHGQN